MKTSARTVLVFAGSLLLTACAATEPRSTGAEFSLAASYMQAVERNARNKGIDVVWINAPARALTETRSDDE